MRNSNVPRLIFPLPRRERLMAFSTDLFAREAIVDAAGRRVNVIGNRDTFQRAEFVQRECFDLLFHHDFLSPFKASPNKSRNHARPDRLKNLYP